MGKWLAVAAVLAGVTGCNYGAQQFSCSMNEQCQSPTNADGRCEPDNRCSFSDPACPGGRRYGDLTGGQGQCVGEAPMMMDASIDVPEIDARTCFGTSFMTVCLVAAPVGPLTISTQTTINTDDPQMCAATMSVTNGGDYCVIAATTISVEQRLRATGTRPLVLIASDSITTSAQIDVGSHRGMSPEIGAGANPASCMAGELPGVVGGGGGAGGSFLGSGGPGGTGGEGGTRGLPGGIAVSVTTLRGGCAGQDGEGGNDRGLRGNGGGAVYLIAGTRINIGASINAAGESGAGALGRVSGGGGGGAGGMIGFDAPMITCNGLLVATGGGGGEGSDEAPNTPGAAGQEPTSTAAAGGGAGNTGRGGDGGSGGILAATAAGGGLPGDAGGGTNGGGGGGGGGAGLIKGPAAMLGGNVAPPAIP